MKKIISLFLVACTLFSVVACDKKDVGKKTEQSEEGIIAWATHTTDKQIANIKPIGVEENREYDVYMTRGETEGCQLVMYSPEEIIGSLKVVSGKNDSVADQIFVMNRTHTIKRKEYTDSAVPYNGVRMKFEAKKVVPFIVEFTTTADTPAGDYEYTYELYDNKAKETIATYKVNVHVWDIVLPTEKTFATAIDLRSYCIRGMGDQNSEAYERYYNTLLEHNFSSYWLPYDILDERADAYMSDPRVTSFVVPCESDKVTDEQIIAYYNKIKTNSVWLSKALFYPIDEPRTPEHLEQYKAYCEHLNEIAPGIPVIAPFYTNIQTGDKADQVDFMAPYTDLWCPKLCLWDESQSYVDLKYTPEKSFGERISELKANGDRVWAYVCNDPITPYAQLFIDTDGLMQRIMMWQHYQHDIDGFLYWGANAYFIPEGGTLDDMWDPWETSYQGIADGGGVNVYGEGFVVYPGSKIGLPGAVPSSRLKILRDGVDDIELLNLAEKYLDPEWLMAKVNEITPTLTTYTTEENFYKLRKEIGDALEKALSEQ